ncbi:hypothetical protein [Chondromyces crocatus]|uniref:PBS lyase n=1 Tax=Chondromyces crocatus TaxID=52 RepID=A0A0K1EHU2_CHOCO|nr:hypothetical protein [Chondromyces crocatus]AKT40148.1 uncharacterized protein CMC5_043010 [Chondromyces crocatus]
MRSTFTATRFSFLAAAALSSAACGGAQPATSGDVACVETPAVPPSAATTPAGPDAKATSPNTKDGPVTPPRLEGPPQLVQKLLAATTCELDAGFLDQGCPSLAAWMEHDFTDADFVRATVPMLLTLLDTDDEKAHQVAGATFAIISCDEAIDAAVAARLIAATRKPFHSLVLSALGVCLAEVPVEQHGLSAEFGALVSHPSVSLREAIVGSRFPASQSPWAYEQRLRFLGDESVKVQQEALRTLGVWKPTPALCALLRDHLPKTDHLRGAAQAAAASSTCPGLRDEAVTSMSKHLAEAKLYGNEFGDDFANAVGSICRSKDTPPPLKKKAFTIAKTLTDEKVSGTNVRRTATRQLAICDPVAAKPVLQSLAKDKLQEIRDQASQQLTALDKPTPKAP